MVECAVAANITRRALWPLHALQLLPVSFCETAGCYSPPYHRHERGLLGLKDRLRFSAPWDGEHNMLPFQFSTVEGPSVTLTNKISYLNVPVGRYC